MVKFPANFEFEKSLWIKGKEFIAGLDEVGRGAWAGPVVASAVVFPRNYRPDFFLYDSKLLTAEERQPLAEKIKKVALVGIGVVGVPTINKVGIGKASQKAFRAALKNLSLPADHFLVDAFYIKYLPKRRQTPIVKGDLYCASIAAASVVAKVFRDQLMVDLHEKYPSYGFALNKGYGTPFHQNAIKQFSFSKMHRSSFDLKYLVQDRLAIG